VVISLNAHAVTRSLAGIIVALVLASLGGQLSKHVLGHDILLGLVRLFDVNLEANVPAWYSSMTLLACGVLLGFIAWAKRQAGDRFATHWTVLAVIFVGLSIDEAAAVHDLFYHLRESWPNMGALYQVAWVIPGAVFVLIVGVAYFRFFLAMHAFHRRHFALAGLLYVGGALGMEIVGSYLRYYDLVEVGRDYVLVLTVEETLEMAGMLVFLRALLLYLSAEVGPVRIEWPSGSSAGPPA